MSGERVQKLRQTVLGWFPERRLYLRNGGDVRSIALSTGQQIAILVGVVALLAWTVTVTALMVGSAVFGLSSDDAAARTQAYYERLIADRQARLNAAVAQLSNASGSMDGLARAVTERHAALAMLLSGLHGAPLGLAPLKLSVPYGKTPAEQIQAVEADQIRLVEAADGYAKSRADRLRMAFRLAGLEPSSYAHGSALGGPLIEAKDPRALAAVLDVDEGFAARIQAAARDLYAERALGEAAGRLPLAEPLSNPERSSPFGVRVDPITHERAFHPGQDFAGGLMTPVLATAPGVVSFTGQRTGYGNTVEVDHGGGFKTRYAHLQAIAVHIGQTVALGQRLGGMGSTGRSTGVHLHYEVWRNGRVQDPAPFLKAGDHVQQNDE
jgi:murein DD-endopeptidase MepM/ murein hydrolase activator NlpD